MARGRANGRAAIGAGRGVLAALALAALAVRVVRAAELPSPPPRATVRAGQWAWTTIRVSLK